MRGPPETSPLPSLGNAVSSKPRYPPYPASCIRPKKCFSHAGSWQVPAPLVVLQKLVSLLALFSSQHVSSPDGKMIVNFQNLRLTAAAPETSAKFPVPTHVSCPCRHGSREPHVACLLTLKSVLPTLGLCQNMSCCVTQVNEFGQCPTQLFTEPHPPRRVSPPWSAPGLNSLPLLMLATCLLRDYVPDRAGTPP